MSSGWFHQEDVDALIHGPPEFDPYKNFQPTRRQQTFLIASIVLSVVCPVCAWLFACFLTPTKRTLRKYFVFAEVISIVWAFVCIVGAGFLLTTMLFDLS